MTKLSPFAAKVMRNFLQKRWMVVVVKIRGGTKRRSNFVTTDLFIVEVGFEP